MAANDLHDPLGLDGPIAGPPGRDPPWAFMIIGGVGALALGLVAFSLMTDVGMGGRPFADAAVQPIRADDPATAPPAAVATTQPALPVVREGAPENGSGPAIFDLATGVRVGRQATSNAPGALVLKLPQLAPNDPVGLQLAPAPDPRLVEKGPHGPLPRIGADGSRPSEVYARPVVSAARLKAGAPRIAIVVGGMGLNPAATTAAVETLPDAVTLGFAPYGADVERQAARAREAGHEILVQAPMEPLDKSAIPGPYTLLAGADAAQNIDGLRWVMSRMSGYVGVANFLGARLMAREADLAPVLREISARGLLFFDDGTATLSMASSLAGAVGMPVARADVVLDANGRLDAIETALGRLETAARTKGFAIGYAAGLPGSIDAVARFAQGLEKRGVALVPLSALAARGTASAGLAN